MEDTVDALNSHLFYTLHRCFFRLYYHSSNKGDYLAADKSRARIPIMGKPPKGVSFVSNTPTYLQEDEFVLCSKHNLANAFKTRSTLWPTNEFEMLLNREKFAENCLFYISLNSLHLCKKLTILSKKYLPLSIAKPLRVSE